MTTGRTDRGALPFEADAVCTVVGLSGVELRPADARDVSDVITMAREFYARDNLPFGPESEAAIGELIDRPDIGQIVLITQAQGQMGDPAVSATVGYAALIWGFSIERGGRDAYLHEYYLAPSARGQGIGQAVLDTLLDRLSASDFYGMYLEVLDTNAPAQRVYRINGFQARGRMMFRSLRGSPS